MKSKKLVKIRLIAMLLTLSPTISSLNAASEGFWSTIWGNLDTASENKKDMILVRRTAILGSSALAICGVGYALWKHPKTNKFIRKLLPEEHTLAISNGSHSQQTYSIPSYGSHAHNTQPKNYPPVRCPVVRLNSLRQGGNECGVYALCNAVAIQECWQNNQAITSDNVQNHCGQAYNRFRQSNRNRQNLWCNQIVNAREALFGGTLSGNNSAILGLRNNGTASPEVSRVVANFTTRRINSAHFVTHVNGGHWVLISIVRNNNRYNIYYMDSANNGTPNRDAQQAINHLGQRLNLS